LCGNPRKQTEQKSTSKAGQVVDGRADLLKQMPHSKLNCHTLLGEELTKQLQLKCNTAIRWEINSADHPAGSGKSTSPHNLNLTDSQNNKTLLTSQSPGETTSELLLICEYQDWMLEE
jgi:hypothetical protein